MMRLSLTSAFTALTLLIPLGSAQSKGFNYGATSSTGACHSQSDFESQFNSARSLPGTSGFTSARLYTTIQCGTINTPTAAIQAAIDTNTQLLLGLWASAGDAVFNNEVAALQAAIAQYGVAFTSLVVGISVGSEDLYRSSPQGIANNAGIGTDAATLTRYISQLRSALSSTALSGTPVGHVDTWTAWILSSSSPVIQASDWLGHNSFPYFETTLPNSIDNAVSQFSNALAATESVASGKPVFVTETGWPVMGPTMNLAVPSTQNARTYWSGVGCALLFGHRNTWWYTLEDGNAGQQQLEFGVIDGEGGPVRYDLSC